MTKKTLTWLLLLFFVCAYEKNTFPVKISIETGNKLHVLQHGKEEKLGIKISNRSDKKRNVEFTYTITNINGSVVQRGNVNVKLASRKEHLAPLPKPEKFGIYYVHIIPQNLKICKNLKHRFAYMTPPGLPPIKPSGFIFGICEFHPAWKYNWKYLDLLAEAAGMCGAEIVRISFEPSFFQPQKGKSSIATIIAT